MQEAANPSSESEPSAPSNGTAHHVGCCELPPGMSRANYFQKLSFLEIAPFVSGSPARKIVRGWREKSPEGVRYSVVAHPELLGKDAFSTDSAASDMVDKLVDTCQVLQAEAVVFPTTAAFSPSSANRDRMKAFFNELATAERFGNTARVWSAEGLWENESAGTQADALDLVLAIDPLARDPLDENAEFVAERMARSQAYLRIMGLGQTRKRFEPYQLEMLGEMLGELAKSWTVFGHPGRYPDALALGRELAAMAE